METLLTLIRDIAGLDSLAGIAQTVRIGARSLVGADGVSFVLQEAGQCHYLEEDAIAPL